MFLHAQHQNPRRDLKQKKKELLSIKVTQFEIYEIQGCPLFI